MLSGLMRYMLLLFACVLTLATPLTALAEKKITLAIGDWPPYFSEEFQHGGLVTRICTEAFKLGGLEVQYAYMPWKRAYTEALHGDFDGTAVWRKTPQRDELFYTSDPVIFESIVFFYRKSRPIDWEELGNLGNLTIGVTLGYLQEMILAPVVREGGGRLDRATTDTANFQKLIRGRIDTFPCSTNVGKHLLRTQFKPEEAATIAMHPKSLDKGSLHLFIPKAHPNGQELIEIFNRGLKTLRKKGLYDRYLSESAAGDYLPAYYNSSDRQQNKPF